MQKINVKALGLAFGVFWGAAVFLIGLSSMLFGFGGAWVPLISSCYIGFKATWAGSVIGGIWGFFDGLVCGLVLAWLYNRFARQ